MIYPTDTVYGIGCDATNSKSVERIREIKQSKKPFSVIAPSKDWIRENCEIQEKYLEMLPGPYTFLVKPKSRLVCKETILGSEKIGIRIPNHEITREIQESGKPFITTSINKTGEPPYTDIKQIPKSILDKVDIIIDLGEISNKPSKILDLTTNPPQTIRI